MMWTTIVFGVQLTLIKRLKVKISGKNQVHEVLMTSQFPNHASVIGLCIQALKRIELRIWNASGYQIISISLGDTDF